MFLHQFFCTTGLNEHVFFVKVLRRSGRRRLLGPVNKNFRPSRTPQKGQMVVPRSPGLQCLQEELASSQALGQWNISTKKQPRIMDSSAPSSTNKASQLAFPLLEIFNLSNLWTTHPCELPERRADSKNADLNLLYINLCAKSAEYVT